MRILLIGDYSGLHSALKKGLMQHAAVEEVVLIGDGDKFKDFQVDVSIRPTLAYSRGGVFVRKAIHKVFGWDIAELEVGWRAQQQLKKKKDFDVVQLINDRPIQTLAFWERRILKRLFNQNKKVFLLSCGIDVFGLQYLMAHPEELSLLQPLLANPQLRAQYGYVDVYRQKGVIQTQQMIVEHCVGIIASDVDYVNPNKTHSKYLGLIPHPVVLESIPPLELLPLDCVRIFLGINRGNYHQKGIVYFEEALQQIQLKYGTEVEVIIAEQMSYQTYKKVQATAHIVLDQVFSKDQGYNALEAMARGQVVFTGASKEFLAYYTLQEDEVCIEAKPNVAYLVDKLSFLIDTKSRIHEIGQRAQAFVREVHDCQTIAKQYVTIWESKK
ncbi:glycosyltransferase family 1 protein [Myroides sp. 1354]|uniref:glycosyltransferase n=1 Tax=unclassified Myroides TaxID=2642485 RepID=UPI0025770D51|nr:MULTISPECIES: glycosyltransferase [unclassified Myroides]MDM1046239.1 glycosyltransferase family 1 protein [Myroides sp. R163-1]MDM1057175.1 glycosyltransferase family 1 protein [Myroides sp. 1354]MDM1070370.1 glycosyltransferase family 1 protein [Myroides sp. 1372]